MVKNLLKYIIFLWVISGCQRCEHRPPPMGMQVYIGIGQSVMAGYLDSPQIDAPDKHLKMFKNGQWQVAQEPVDEVPGAIYGPMVSFGKTMRGFNPSVEYGVINCAVGSTTIDEWMAGSCSNPNLPQCGLWEQCMTKVQQAMSEDRTAQVAGILYNEGQSLASECQDTWVGEFPQFVNQVNSRFGSIPIVFAQLGTVAGVNCGPGFLDHLRNEQASLNIASVYMISTVDLPTVDGTHLTTPGQMEQGSRFGVTMNQACSLTQCHDPWFMRLLPHN